MPRPNVFFETIRVPHSKPILDLDKFFLSFTLYRDDSVGLKHLLDHEWWRLDGYLKRPYGLRAAHAKNSEKQSKYHETSVNHIRRYFALCKVQSACALIAQQMKENQYKKCVIFALSRACMFLCRAFLLDYKARIVYPGSDQRTIDSCQKSFGKGMCRVLIVHIQAGHGLDLTATQHAFFMEEHLDVRRNVKALWQLYGEGQKSEVYVKNFCTPDPLDIKLSEMHRERSEFLAYKHYKKPNLPEEFL